jgi:UDP-N-acetylmuramoyl-L-alanyl-D-glutamate--2,6-diaminopimelate ligase
MKRLVDLVKGIPCEIQGNSKIEIKGIAYHSARVESGYLFVAIDGFKQRGTDFIAEAANRGAAAVATTDVRNIHKSWVTGITTTSPRRFLAQVANRYYDFPARKLGLVGVTGTNGKTTTAFLLREMARKQGAEPGFTSTVEYWDGEEKSKAAQTTPESLDFVRILDRLVSKGVATCIAEVSSHALELDRTFDLDFKVAVFTNLSQDHLDFHKTFQAYRDAKMKLFTGLGPTGKAVVNFDDGMGRDIADLVRGSVTSYGLRDDLTPAPEIVGKVVRVYARGIEVEVRHEDNVVPVRLRLAGRHNVMNLLAAYGAGVALGWPRGAIVAGAEALENVPGRLERLENDRGFGVFVDYAHTPDALARVLDTVREFTEGKVIAVFGCGGDRDRDKRPKMGGAVAERADVAVVTSDNPRSEEPQAIIDQILQGMRNGADRIVEPDRRQAIATALGRAAGGDTVVIAGKGHEEYQLVGTERLEFDDRKVAAGLLKAAG